MKQILRFPIECGEKTCASEPGKFCSFLGGTNMGITPVCRLFPSVDRAYTILEDKDGWVQRCESCLTQGVGENHEGSNI